MPLSEKQKKMLKKLEKALYVCGDALEVYKSVMNNMATKTWIAQNIFRNKGWEDDPGAWYVGSWITYPANKSAELKKYYGNAVDGQPMDKVVRELKRDVINNKIPYRYRCFILAAIVKTDNVSHHIGFIYDKQKNILQKLDPGIQSWGTALAGAVDAAIAAAFPNTKVYSGYSGKWWGCMGKAGPQDFTRGSGFYDLAVYVQWKISSGETARMTHRESYCQTWSLLMILNQVERLKAEGSSVLKLGLLGEWHSMKASELEMCIRRFILWVVFTFDKDSNPPFQYAYETSDSPDLIEARKKYSDYGELLLVCMKTFSPKLEVPANGDYAMCPKGISLTTPGQAMRIN